MGNFRKARLPAALRTYTDANGLPEAWLNFEADEYFYPFFKPSGFDAWPGLTASGGANGRVFQDGVLVAATAPRLGDGGLVVDNEASELLSYSADFTNASWLTEAGVSRSSTVTGPVDGYSAQRFAYASGNGRVQKNVSITTNRHTVFAIGRPVAPFNYLCVRLPLVAGGAWVTLAVDFDDLSVAQSSSHHSNISVTTLNDGYALIRFEFVSEAAPTLAFYFFGTDSIGVNAGNFSQPSQAGSFDLALLSVQEGVHATPIVTEDVLLTRTADSVTLATADLGWADDQNFTAILSDASEVSLTATDGVLTLPASAKPYARLVSPGA